MRVAAAYELDRSGAGTPAHFSSDGTFVPQVHGARIDFKALRLTTYDIVDAGRLARNAYGDDAGFASAQRRAQKAASNVAKEGQLRRWIYHARDANLSICFPPTSDVHSFIMCMAEELRTSNARGGAAVANYVSTLNTTFKAAFGISVRADPGTAETARNARVIAPRNTKARPPSLDLATISDHYATQPQNAALSYEQHRVKLMTLFMMVVAARPAMLRGLQLIGPRLRLCGADGATIDMEDRLRATGAHKIRREATARSPAIYEVHPLQAEVHSASAELHWPKDKRALEWSATIQFHRPTAASRRSAAYRTQCDFVACLVDWAVRIGADRACVTGATRTATNNDSRHFGPTLFAKANGTEPGATMLAHSVCDNLIAIGFISADAAGAAGRGKVLRKYASSAVRLLSPMPSAATAEILHARNGHSYSEWRDTYQVEACQRHAQAWQRLSREAQRSCVIEDLLLL